MSPALSRKVAWMHSTNLLISQVSVRSYLHFDTKCWTVVKEFGQNKHLSWRRQNRKDIPSQCDADSNWALTTESLLPKSED